MASLLSRQKFRQLFEVWVEVRRETGMETITNKQTNKQKFLSGGDDRKLASLSSTSYEPVRLLFDSLARDDNTTS